LQLTGVDSAHVIFDFVVFETFLTIGQLMTCFCCVNDGLTTGVLTREYAHLFVLSSNIIGGTFLAHSSFGMNLAIRNGTRYFDSVNIGHSRGSSSNTSLTNNSLESGIVSENGKSWSSHILSDLASFVVVCHTVFVSVVHPSLSCWTLGAN